MVIFDVIPAILELNSQMNFRFGFGNPRNGQPDDSPKAKLWQSHNWTAREIYGDVVLAVPNQTARSRKSKRSDGVNIHSF